MGHTWGTLRANSLRAQSRQQKNDLKHSLSKLNTLRKVGRKWPDGGYVAGVTTVVTCGRSGKLRMIASASNHRG